MIDMKEMRIRALEKTIKVMGEDMNMVKALIQQNNDTLQEIMAAIEKEKQDEPV
jgi:hypothetical protein